MKTALVARTSGSSRTRTDIRPRHERRGRKARSSTGPIMQDNMAAAAAPGGAGPAGVTAQCNTQGPICLPTPFCPQVTHHACHTILQRMRTSPPERSSFRHTGRRAALFDAPSPDDARYSLSRRMSLACARRICPRRRAAADGCRLRRCGRGGPAGGVAAPGPTPSPPPTAADSRSRRCSTARRSVRPTKACHALRAVRLSAVGAQQLPRPLLRHPSAGAMRGERSRLPEFRRVRAVDRLWWSARWRRNRPASGDAIGCPTHAPQLCPVTPQCPTQLGCPTLAPQLCPVTPHCPTQVGCPTHAPQLCPVTPHCPTQFGHCPISCAAAVSGDAALPADADRAVCDPRAAAVSDHAPLPVGVHPLRDAEHRAMYSPHHAKPDCVPGRERRRLQLPGILAPSRAARSRVAEADAGRLTERARPVRQGSLADTAFLHRRCVTGYARADA